MAILEEESVESLRKNAHKLSGHPRNYEALVDRIGAPDFC